MAPTAAGLNRPLTMGAAIIADVSWSVTAMAIGGLPLFDALKSRMGWHHARQKVLAENIANADTPGFRPNDVKAPVEARSGLQMARTSLTHMSIDGAVTNAQQASRRFETTPSGNGVNLEDEMLKVAQNNQDYQLAASLYQKSLGLMKIAIGRGR
jgi:flagellar basal-body rod protein FlgB